MEKRDIFKNLSPLDHRYYLANRQLFDQLANCLSEEASLRYALRCEAALLKEYVNQAFPVEDHQKFLQNIDELENAITPEEVYQEEEKTQHNLRALVNVIKRHLLPDLVPFVHLGATSADILDSAQALKLRDAVHHVILPILIELELQLIALTHQEAYTTQIGRTHGQFAVPITVGFALAEYVARLGKSILQIHHLSHEVRGKFSGAVGAYNATTIISSDPQAFECRVLESLGLQPSEHSTQLVEPEHVLRLLLEINLAFGIIANLADDLRNLQRSEIGEVHEFSLNTQVGSSTMPQKHNPWNCEHVKSLWKTFCPRVVTFFMDQISEHQRDLTNSASGRFITDYLAGFVAAAARMNKVVATLSVDHSRIRKNLKEGAKDLVLAEAVYILLSLAGEDNAHEVVRQLILTCENKKKSLMEILQETPELWQKIVQQLQKHTGQQAEPFFAQPETYQGQAPQKAQALADKYKTLMQTLQKDLEQESRKKP